MIKKAKIKCEVILSIDTEIELDIDEKETSKELLEANTLEFIRNNKNSEGGFSIVYEYNKEKIDLAILSEKNRIGFDKILQIKPMSILVDMKSEVNED